MSATHRPNFIKPPSVFKLSALAGLMMYGATALAPNYALAQNTTHLHKPPNDSNDRTQVAMYIASMSADLSKMARSVGLDSVGYLLEMARLEAENAAHQPTQAPTKPNERH